MQILKAELPRTHKIFYAGDLHTGSILQHRDGIEQLIAAVASERNNYLVLMGDLAEAILIDDKRYCRSTENASVPTPILQYKDLVKQFKPIRKKILVALSGNHDLKILKYGDGVKDIFCDELGIPYGTYTAKLAIHDNKGRLMYKNLLSHGFGSINSKLEDPARRYAANQAMLKKKLAPLAADSVIQCMGHTHQLIVKPPSTELYLVDDGAKVRHRYTKAAQTDEYINPDLRWFINSGGFYKLYALGASSYCERAGYMPNELGYAMSTVEDGMIKNIERVVLD